MAFEIGARPLAVSCPALPVFLQALHHVKSRSPRVDEFAEMARRVLYSAFQSAVSQTQPATLRPDREPLESRRYRWKSAIRLLKICATSTHGIIRKRAHVLRPLERGRVGQFFWLRLACSCATDSYSSFVHPVADFLFNDLEMVDPLPEQDRAKHGHIRARPSASSTHRLRGEFRWWPPSCADPGVQDGDPAQWQPHGMGVLRSTFG